MLKVPWCLEGPVGGFSTPTVAILGPGGRENDPVMRWLVGFLVLVNAALFLWATGHSPRRSSGASAYPVVSAESMRLLSEVRHQDGSSAQAGRRCARIGPFVNSAVADLAAQKLDAMSMDYSRRTVKPREIRAFRIFLGPFESEAAIDAQRRLLDAAGVKDYYVKHDEPGGGIISLGLFSQRDGAETLLESLRRSEIQAKLRPENRVLQPTFWLEIDDPAVAQGIPPELAHASWGEKGVKITRYGCP